MGSELNDYKSVAIVSNYYYIMWLKQHMARYWYQPTRNSKTFIVIFLLCHSDNANLPITYSKINFRVLAEIITDHVIRLLAAVLR